jgi:hypothetical protein
MTAENYLAEATALAGMMLSSAAPVMYLGSVSHATGAGIALPVSAWMTQTPRSVRGAFDPI